MFSGVSLCLPVSFTVLGEKVTHDIANTVRGLMGSMGPLELMALLDRFQDFVTDMEWKLGTSFQNSGSKWYITSDSPVTCQWYITSKHNMLLAHGAKAQHVNGTSLQNTIFKWSITSKHNI